MISIELHQLDFAHKRDVIIGVVSEIPDLWATALGLGIMLDFLVQFGEGAIQTDETPNKSQVWVGGAKNVLIIPSNMRCTHNAVTFATGGQWL